ncbi:outer membrane lipoprotein chaperone LolA [Candidatus Sulfurimonas marisnigri]|uniref:Outer membrane lipoprotein chaperone LolA n=1 Tax=Candidatus Sulfurimonas marisnigri TaxID=2740405 RepID=A0A7S7RNT1_9BACT|nr:LolA-like outer membrane lipoprotein chaperone [Candidatus Sulfurimonas marisnigri]QOY53622.1 outer membrane lipoprotein chaperone LolA [Candidatus Sulfurimonas marisnigri]
MKYLLLTILLIAQATASMNDVTSFEADFTQSITDDKDKVLTYSGHILASKPQNAKWSYTKPFKKNVFITQFEVTIVEPEIEQVIIKRIESNFDFFKMIANAKKIENNTYETNYKESVFKIIQNNNLIESISYIDEFENRVQILFKNQKQNHSIDLKVFIPNYPIYFDIIRD